MTTLNRTTCRRLRQLPQLTSVWEGDRRVLPNGMSTRDGDAAGECILWVDGSEGVVRAMDVVAPEVGHEAVVRTLLRAMEHPHSFTKPARPRKIVVRDRELQFLLRGILQNLDIVVDYEPTLPVIDELLRGFEEFSSNRPPQLPPQFAALLNRIAATIWEDAPWDYLQEQQIIAITVPPVGGAETGPGEHRGTTEPETLYVSIMGMLGMEYGLLLYRSLESLKQFRASAMQPHSLEVMEEAFLQQDCLFVTYEASEEEADEGMDLATLDPEVIQPNFGNIHPLEGIRPVLYTEEAITVLLALEGLHRFIQKHARKLQHQEFPALSSRFQIPVPVATELQLASKRSTETSPKPSQPPTRPTVTVKVETLPDLAAELLGPETESEMPILRNNLLPEKCLVSIGMLPWTHVRVVRERAEYYQKPERTFPEKGQGLPIVLVQTSRAKAKQLLQQIAEAGGLAAICFNPGEDPFGEEQFDLGILQLANQQLQLFGEYLAHDPIHRNARKKWDQRCRSTQGYCGLVVAMGISVARENPQAEHMLGLYEVPFLTPDELGLGPLQLQPPFLPDWVWEDWEEE